MKYQNRIFHKNQLASSMHLLTNTFEKFDYYWWLMCGNIFIICKNILDKTEKYFSQNVSTAGSVTTRDSSRRCTGRSWRSSSRSWSSSSMWCSGSASSSTSSSRTSPPPSTSRSRGSGTWPRRPFRYQDQTWERHFTMKCCTYTMLDFSCFKAPTDNFMLIKTHN